MDKLREYLNRDRYAALSNVELLDLAPGYARTKMTLQPHHWNGLGTVQGGAIFTLADLAFAAACNSHGTVAVAINVSITFMKAAVAGTLWAEAREVCKNFKLSTCTIEVKDDQGELVALFQGLAYRKADKIPTGENPKAEGGSPR
jgi:acyl-CoA thioesterase